LGKISNLTNIFQMGWFNHQPDCGCLKALIFFSWQRGQRLGHLWGYNPQADRLPLKIGRASKQLESPNNHFSGGYDRFSVFLIISQLGL